MARSREKLREATAAAGSEGRPGEGGSLPGSALGSRTRSEDRGAEGRAEGRAEGGGVKALGASAARSLGALRRTALHSILRTFNGTQATRATLVALVALWVYSFLSH